MIGIDRIGSGLYLKYIGTDNNTYGLQYGEVFEVKISPSAYEKGGIIVEWNGTGTRSWKRYSSLKALTQEWSDSEPVKRHGRKR